MQDSDGTIAYLTDLNSKLDEAIFNFYTGTTAPNTYVDWTYFSGYSATTLTLINTKQDKLIEGDYISISGNVISVTGLTSAKALQLIDTIGGQSVNNIISIPIDWTTTVFSGTSLSYTGGSRIYIQESTNYDLSYVLNVNNATGSGKNIGTLIRKNSSDDITPMSSASINTDLQNDSSTNTMPNYKLALSSGDYIELVAFRIGKSGGVFTVNDGSWIKIQKII